MQLILASQSEGRKQLLFHLQIPFKVIPSALDEEKIVGKNPIETLKLRARLKGEEVAKQITDNRQQITKNKNLTTYNSQLITYNLQPKPYLILSADSGAIIDNKLIGKPRDYKDAVRIMKLLSGKTHQFVTAVYMMKILNIKNQKSKIHIKNQKWEEKALKTPRGWQAEAGAQAMTPPMVEETEKVWHDQDRSLVTFRKLSEEDIKLYLSLTDYTRYAGGYAIASAQNFITRIEGSISNVIGLPLEKVISIFIRNKLI